jgi:hypothetical protein
MWSLEKLKRNLERNLNFLNNLMIVIAEQIIFFNEWNN